MLLLVPGEGYGEERRVKCRTGPGQVGAWPPRLAAATTGRRGVRAGGGGGAGEGGGEQRDRDGGGPGGRMW